MNAFVLLKQATAAKVITLFAIAALVASVMPAIAHASTVITTPTSLSIDSGELGNFKVTAVYDTTATGTHSFTVSDNGGGGNFYDGTVGGACNTNVPDADSSFAIGGNKGVCYSNNTPGVYTVTVELFSSVLGSISSTNLQVTVNDDTDPATTTDDTATSTDDGAATSTDDGTGTSTDNGTGTSTDDTATSTDNGTSTSTDNGTSTSTDDGTSTSTDTDTSTSTDDGSSNGGGSNDQVDGCEFEGHKYDQFGNPLKDWVIGLMKIITHNNGADVYTLSEEITDEDGYVCLTWNGEDRTPFNGMTPSYVDGPYDFTYWLYERMQSGWLLNAIEMGDVDDLQEVAAENIVYGDGYVRVQYGEENGYVLNDAAFHIDFYNIDPNATSTDGDTGTTTATSTDDVAEGGGGGNISSGGSGSGGSRSSGTRIGSRTTTVTDEPTPTPLVLGDQVSAVPLGAANTGAGGSQSTMPTATLLLLALVAVAGARRVNV